MERGDQRYQQYIQILREELRPAMGCTEPIALALAGAKAREYLGALPDRIHLLVSGNIIKNVKSVVVPNTGGLHGMQAAVCAGIVAGDPDRQLQVISRIPQQKQPEIRRYLDSVKLSIRPSQSGLLFDIDLLLFSKKSSSPADCQSSHQCGFDRKNGEVLWKHPVTACSEDILTNKSCLNVKDIAAFADVTLGM